MVKNSGKTLCTDTIKPLSIPEPVCVEENDCTPIAVRLNRRQTVISIEDKWRIDDEWWRSDHISRLYYAVILTSGHRLVLYKDIAKKCWYIQK
jgi:hypothetical protein